MKPAASDDVNAAIRHCASVIRDGSRSFALAARLFDPETRDAVVSLYGWCRYCDDRIDSIAGDAAVAGRRLGELRRLTLEALAGRPRGDTVFTAFGHVMSRYGIPSDYPLELIEGMAMDVCGQRYETADDLMLYCYRVAGTVGLMLTHVMGVSDEKALRHAAAMGMAMQLTNIARDLLEDHGRGRVYLPLSWLAETGLPPEDFAQPVRRPELAVLARRLLTLADDYYRSGDQGLRYLPLRAACAVAAVGGGLAGIAAASLLGERGFRVCLFDKNPYLGGKVGSWEVRFPDGFRAWVDHGFHAFFRHYYNLSRFLDETGSSRHLEAIDDYLIVDRSGRRYGFAGVETTPVLNILSLWRHGLFSLRDVAGNRGLADLGAMLRYHPRRTFAEWDGTSYEELARRTRLPEGLKLVFGAFARAFFTPGHRISAAELIKSFHFFFLSHDHGLLYDYFTRGYREALIEPVLARLSAAGVWVELGVSVDDLAGRDGRFMVRGRPFDHVVLAADAAGARRLAERSSWLRESAPDLHRRLTGLRSSPGYAVLRLWSDRRAGDGWPVFVATEKIETLDSITFYHRFDADAREWAARTGGGVYELHCYAVPPELSTESRVRQALLRELRRYLPELRDARVLYEHLQLRRDFTAFDRNLYEERPGYDPGVAGLYLAGDWVKLPVPAMLMEAAFTSGLLSANAILAANGLREEPVWSVARKGILA